MTTRIRIDDQEDFARTGTSRERYKNKKRRSQRLREDRNEQRTLKNKTVRSLTSEDREYDAEKKTFQLSITQFYALGVSLLITRPNTRYTPAAIVTFSSV